MPRRTTSRSTYPVVWREAGGTAATGALALFEGRFELRGSSPSGEIAVVSVPYADIASVRIGRAHEELVGDHKTVVVERRGRLPLHVGTLDALGAVLELAELLAEQAGAAQVPGTRVLVIVPIKRGSRERAEELVHDGPPFDLGALELERHEVFLTDRECVFLFEGAEAASVVAAISRMPGVWKAGLAWNAVLDGRPRIARLEFAWSRDYAPAAR